MSEIADSSITVHGDSLVQGAGESTRGNSSGDIATKTDAMMRSSFSAAMSTLPWVGTWIVAIAISAFLASTLTVTAHGKTGFFTATFATVICLLAALFDAWTTRIPNWLTYIAILAGLTVNLVATVCAFWHFEIAEKWIAAPGISQSLLGFGVCALIGLVGLLVARVGGGDIKLLAALGAFLGLADVGNVLILALSAAVIYSLLNLVVMGKLNTAMRITSMRMLELIYFRRFHTVLVEPKKSGVSMIPMAVPLAVGLVIAQFLNLKSFFFTAVP